MHLILRVVLLALIAFPLTAAHAQTLYSGTLGKQPIQLVVYAYSDGVVIATYAYDKFDTPIRLNGHLRNGVLELHEIDPARDVATLRFDAFNADREALQGEWRPVTGKPLPIALRRQFTAGPQQGPDDPELEWLQAASTPEHYFKVATGGTGSGSHDRVFAVAVYRKRTDALVQRIDVDTQFRGIDSVQVGDFDFDGVEDFSLFESSYAGPNTSSLYFLRDAATGQYVAADFQGVSLEFDAASKRVFEHNQCCAGSRHQNATYRVEGRKLVLEEQHCMAFVEGKEDFVEVPCE